MVVVPVLRFAPVKYARHWDTKGVHVAGIVFGAIAPHGHLAIPEACVAADVGIAGATQEAMVELGHRFAAARPDVTILFTPHNVHAEGAFAVITAGNLAGNLANWTTADVHLRCPVDRDLAHGTLTALRAAGIPAIGISYGGNDAARATAPMDWGALIPLWFMGGREDPPVPVVIVAPARDRSLAEHVEAGKAIARAAADSGKRVAVIASSDHGHAHLASGPYGYDPAAAEYDARIVSLVRENRLPGLLEIDPDLVQRASADSYWQMAMLHGALGDGWEGSLLSYEVPTYFGMLCAAYTRA
jgi:aromatic ring-opening dioxygenase LigB subunit